MKPSAYISGLLTLSVTLMATSTGLAQSYDDVAVIINSASPASVEIGRYFQAARAIPESNIITISAPVTETINGSQFDSLRASIESAINATGKSSLLNYLVTTKGLPLRVDRGNPGTSYSGSASVEGELTLILGANAARIGLGGGCVSPYYNATRHFSRSSFGMYLVTRLDGYTVADVKGLIDRSGPSVYSGAHARFVFDQDPTWSANYSYLNNSMSSASTTLLERGCTVELNTDTLFLTHEENVAGYVSWGSNDRNAADFSVNAVPENTWAPGAIVETYVSTSGRTFEEPVAYGQSVIADLVHEGVSGAKGYVYEPFTLAMANVATLFDRYTNGYNLAESYYSASLYVSWMDVVIGDPKTSIVQSAPLPVQLISFDGRMISQGHAVLLTWSTASEMQCYGFEVQRRFSNTCDFASIGGSFVAGNGTTAEPHTYSWVDTARFAGSAEYRLRQIDMDGTSRFSDGIAVVSDMNTTAIAAAGMPESLEMLTSYPNPFNPSTTIRFDVPRSASAGGSADVKIRLTVYDMTGRELQVLLDGNAAPGSHEYRWNAGNSASGTYFCVLTTPAGNKVLRMLLIR
jgi:uncharacterized protein (TIGR03790 family)